MTKRKELILPPSENPMPKNMAEFKSNLEEGKMKSAKEIVDEQIDRAKFKHDAEKEQEQIFEDFKAWTEKPDPKFLDQHLIKEHELIIRVYGFRPKKEGAKIFLDHAGTRTSEDLSHRTFPIAKVLKAGKDAGYEAGTFVKLRDFEVSSIENPEYSMWLNNEYSKSNLRKVGSEPPKFLNNIGKYFGPKMIVLNPLKAKLEEDDFLTFKITPSDISNGLKDVLAFIG